MQAAAMSRVKRRGVDAATIEKKLKSQDLLRQEGKPEAMLDNIAKGKLLVSLKIIL
jgi:elongation factor Ts